MQRKKMTGGERMKAGKEKGEYGSRNHSRRMRLTITLILAAAIAAQLIARWMTDNQAAKNILTVMAILTVLPMANMASPLLASWKYRTPGRDFYDKIHPYEEKIVILYDLILTTKEQMIPADVAAVHPQGIFLFVPEKKLDIQKAEKGLQALFAGNKLDLKIRLIRDEAAFLKRLDSLKSVDSSEDDGTVSYAARLLKSLSM